MNRETCKNCGTPSKGRTLCEACRQESVESLNEHGRLVIARNKKFVLRYKKAHRCVGFEKACPCPHEPEILQFDHVVGEKDFDISTRMQVSSLEILKREIAKCVLRCPFCHALKTKYERDFGYWRERPPLPPQKKSQFPLVDGLFYPGEIARISGPVSSGKSMLALHLAGVVSGGEKFLGRFQCAKGDVLLIDGRHHFEVISDRSKDLRIETVDVISVKAEPASVIKNCLEKIDREYSLIVVDTKHFLGEGHIADFRATVDPSTAIVCICTVDEPTAHEPIARGFDAELILSRQEADGHSYDVEMHSQSERFRVPLFGAEFTYPNWKISEIDFGVKEIAR